MAAVVTDNPDQDRFEIRVDGELAGIAVYHRAGNRIVFLHTEVDDAYEGQGLGKTLAREALDSVRAAGLEVVPKCPFIAGFIKRHREYADLVPESRRAEFDLV